MSANVYSVLDRVAEGWKRAAGVGGGVKPPPVQNVTQSPRTFTTALGAATGVAVPRQDLPSVADMAPSPINMPSVGSMFQAPSEVRFLSPDPRMEISPLYSQVRGLGSFREQQEAKKAAKELEQWGSGEGNYDTGEGRGLSGVKQWDQQIKAAAQQFGIPWQVVAAIMGIESGGDPRVISVAGARGLMQIMPEYWQHLADQYDGNLMNPETNIKVGAQILKILYDKYGSWDKAAAAYLGAIDEFGNITSAADAYGTSGYTYVDLFNQNLRALGYGAPSPAEAAAGGAPATPQAVQAMNFVMNEAIGVPYVWAGADLNGFDCSGLTLWAFAKAGIRLPRTAAEQYYATQRVDHTQVQPGDLVFFANTNGPGITHVGIYIGNGQFVHAPTEGKTVQVTSLNDPFWGKHIAGYGRAF